MVDNGKKMDAQKLLTRLSVLVVEDSDFDRELAITTLQKIGIQKIQVAENGSLAIGKITNALAIKKPFDVIFLDAKMPSEDGLKVLNWIRKEPKLKNQIVVMVTATTNSSDVAAFIDLGISGYVVKPLTLEVLQSKVNDILSLLEEQKKRHAS